MTMPVIPQGIVHLIIGDSLVRALHNVKTITRLAPIPLILASIDMLMERTFLL